MMLEPVADVQTLGPALRGKRVLVTGGTGSFGNQIVRELINYEPDRILILSRDEDKQYHMKHAYRDQRNLGFIIADVRDYRRLCETFRGVHVVFHAAALKQVPGTETAPFEAVKTNIIGAENVRGAAIASGVETVIAISTDKAVKPVNVMGMSKAIQERIFLNPDDDPSHATRFLCVRYGNVLGSRGSVVPLFIQKIRLGLPLPITHVEMTRFLLTLRTAVDLVFRALLAGNSGEVWVRKMPAARIVDLARVLAYGLTDREDYPQEIVGVRPGEKIHEVLISEEEMFRAEEKEDMYVIRRWFETRPTDSADREGVCEYTSNTAPRFTDDELFDLLSREGLFG